MRTNTNRDFASLLDDLLLEMPEEHASAARPTIPFDYLSVAEELHSGRIKVFSDAVDAEYREAGAGFEAGLAALLGGADHGEKAAEADLPSVEPEAIAMELGLGTTKAADFGKLRRSFAFKNHPDRVAPHLRQRALARMQVANRLIDDAKRQAIAKLKS